MLVRHLDTPETMLALFLLIPEILGKTPWLYLLQLLDIVYRFIEICCTVVMSQCHFCREYAILK